MPPPIAQFAEGVTRSSVGRDGKQLGASFQEVPFDFAILKPIERAPGNEHEIDPGWYVVLVLTKHFAQSAFGPIALHRSAHRGTRCDKSHPMHGAGNFRGWLGRRGDHSRAMPGFGF